ncbi:MULTISPECIES: sugar transferase [unclassified Exiguobacterium]|uniref:sugar transferase n=1 Tax=unclassified Exiguobacterium TaxID=2644629 RepID=UPI002036C7E8|nr:MULTISPECIES: sugar transferase [unclassified Exiguobacterium]
MNQVDETSVTLITDIENEQHIGNDLFTNKDNLSYVLSKRIFDIIFSLLAIVFLGIAILLIYLLLKVSDPKGKVFFSQSRFGLNSKRFKMFKFRSMVSDAEQRLKSNTKLYEKYLMNNYKLDPEEDPRMTNMGRFLRKYSIDEIPQFFNVLKGEMSIVGPRPIVDEELFKEYGKDSSLFLSVKPGITGYWQANGRSNVGYPERKAMELFYIKNKSIKMDILIIFKTVKSILLKEGAY